MITKTKLNKNAEVAQKIQLVDGTFTPSEALDVINGLLDEKINFHKLQRLALSERNINNDTTYPDGRVAELQQEKKSAREIISEARTGGYQIKINGILEIEFVK